MNLNWGWENEEDDEKVFTALNRFVERIVESVLPFFALSIFLEDISNYNY